MLAIHIILLLVINLLLPVKVFGLDFSQSKNRTVDICYDTSKNYFTCYGGFDDSSFHSIEGSDLSNLQSTNPITLELLGFINIKGDINFTLNKYNILIVGSPSDKDYEETYIKGNNSNIYGVNTLKFNAWGSASLDSFNFYNLKEVIVDNTGYKNQLINLNFFNNNDLNVSIKNSSVAFNNVTFNMLDSSRLNLNFIPNKHSMIILGNSIKITGNNNATAVVNLGGQASYNNIILQGINSDLVTNINVNNTKLTVEKEINLKHKNSSLFTNQADIVGNFNFLSSNNTVKLSDSILVGKINFFNKSNDIKLINVLGNTKIDFHESNNSLWLSNVKLDKNSEINFRNKNNHITIESNFSGKISLINDDNIILQNAILQNSSINSSGMLNLKFDSSDVKNSSTFVFRGNCNNNLTFVNTKNSANLIFNNKGVNNLVFDGNDPNYFYSNLNIADSSEVNLRVKSNSEAVLSYTSNKNINNFILEDSAVITVLNKQISVNKFIQQGNSIINIDLNTELDSIIYAKNTSFNNSKIFLQIHNNNLLLTNKGDVVEFQLLKSDNKIDNLEGVILGKGLFDFQVMYGDKAIKIAIKKTNTINDLVNKYYKSENTLFYKSDLITLAKYLDILWKNDRNSNIVSLLDYIANNSDNSKNMLEFLTELFPISNNILYNSSYDSGMIFAVEVSSHNNMSNNQVWSSVYHADNNYTLGNVDFYNINLKGNGISTGVNCSLLKNISVGGAVGLSLSNISNYNYNIELLNYNAAIYSNFEITNNFHTLNSLILSFNSFSNDHTVFKDGNYDHNLSYPKSISYMFNNEWNYNFLLFKNDQFSYSLVPELDIKIGNTTLNNYTEKGNEALKVDGFNVVSSSGRIGISSLFNINLNKSMLSSKLNISLERSLNNLKETTFKFKDTDNSSFATLADFHNHQTYLNLGFALEYTTLKQLLGIKLLVTHKASEYNSNSNVSLSVSYKL